MLAMYLPDNEAEPNLALTLIYTVMTVVIKKLYNTTGCMNEN
jgi:hypothetical protein